MTYTEVKQRKTYLDLIKIFAIFLVLYTHISADGLRFYKTSSDLSIQIPYLLIDCFRTINNPLLFMTSGALLLGKEEPIVTVWKKRVLRFVIVLIVFSFIHILDTCYKLQDWSSFDVGAILVGLINGPVRTSYWYLYSYISFLIILPFLRKIANHIKPQDSIYLFVLGIFILDFFRIIKLCLNISRVNITIYFSEMIILYPLLGYSIDSFWDELKDKKKKYIILGILSLVGLSAAAYMTYYEHSTTQKWTENWITLFNTLLASFIFVTLKYLGRCITRKGNQKIQQGIKFLSGTMFGIYLLENILRAWTRPLYLYLFSVIPVFPAVCIWIISIMLLGNIIVGLIKLIPGVKKYL